MDAEQLHHETQPADRINALEQFYSRIKAAFAELDDILTCKPDVPLNECDMKRLEELGEVTMPREFR